MPSLKDLRNRIASVKSTQKITKAMQMVAASKLRRAEESVKAARPYARRIDLMLAAIGANHHKMQSGPPLFVGTGKEETHLLLVATAERGLCGPFNSSIARAAGRCAASLLREGKTIKILCVGRKGRDVLQRQFGAYIVDTIELSGIRRLAFADVAPIAVRVLDMFEAGEFDVCTIFFNHFRSVMTQIVTEQRLIPVPLSDTDDDEPVIADLGDATFEYEPAEDSVLEAVLPHNVSFQIFQAVLENAASEQGARMTAMDSATRNAGEMIDGLTLNYNRTRQAVITNELIEIISGAEAV
jgi:F-type H+-transporting ATPase subunit gamma